MKWIKSRSEFIKEAFDSKSISNTISYIKSNCSNKDADRFLASLRKIMDLYDYPISKLNDRHIQYMSKIKALPLKSSENIVNGWGIWSLKFWFSLEEGYLGYTGTGNKSVSYVENRIGTKSFTNREINKLSDFVKKGKLIPVKSVSDYEGLEEGDLIAGYFSSYEDSDYLSFATVYKEDGKIYAIQDVSDGGVPYSSRWRDYGRSSWVIFDNGVIENDHLKLHYYVEDNKDLRCGKLEEDNDENVSYENPLSWNLPLNGKNLSNWSSAYSSIDSEDLIKSADFAIILNFDDMLNPDKAEYYEKPTDIRTEREKSREGALALKTDYEIRSENVERYLNKLVGLLGISKDKLEFSNLQKLILKVLMGKLSLIIIINRKHGGLSVFKEKLYDLMESEEDYKDNYYSGLISYYSLIGDQIGIRNKHYSEVLSIIDNDLDDFIEIDEKEIFIKLIKRCFDIGEKISTYISNKQINTIEDLTITLSKLDTIHSLITADRKFSLSDKLTNLLKSFDTPTSFEYYLGKLSKEELIDDEIKLNNIEKAIDSILK